MDRSVAVRAVMALVLIAISAAAALTTSPQLGLDLRGGTQIMLEIQDAPGVEADAEAADRTLEVLRNRVDALGVAEPTLARSGERRIIVELPGLTEPAEAAEVIGRTAQLTMHPVLGEQPAGEATGEDGSVTDEQGSALRLGPPALSGDDVASAVASFDAQSGAGWVVSIDFAGPGRDAWQELTAQAACAPLGDPQRRIAIVLDDRIISSPAVVESIVCGRGMHEGSTQISGGFTEEEARELAVLIEGGALPVPVEIIEQRTVGPTLGADAIEASAKAAVLGMALTAIFLVVVYRLIGVVALVALASYALIAYAALTLLGATLTLPGLAGFVLAIGMAVDANVLIAERAREAQARVPNLVRSLDTGHRAALPAIIDSAVTTLLAAVLLFWLASGPVRGFGVTLTIGVLVALVSALVISRVLGEFLVSRRFLRANPRMSGLGSTGRLRTWLTSREPTLMDRHRRWLVASGVVVLIAISGMALRGLELGVEFTGGRLIEYTTERAVDAETARSAIGDAGFPRVVVQESGGGEGLTVRGSQLSDTDVQTIRGVLAETTGGAEVLTDERIGPSLGAELRQGALIALGVALAAQMIYLAARFRWTFGAGAVTALFGNVAVVIGAFAWLGKPLDGVFLAALLTIIGYTVNDSVIVFDRVREMWKAEPGTKFRRVVSSAVLATLPRTVNTGLSTVLILLALWIFGGNTLADFALALLIGVTVGVCSTISISAPLAIELESHRTTPPPAPKKKAAPVRRDDGAVV